MINLIFEERCKLLNKDMYKASETEFELEEQIHDGKAKLRCSLDKYCIAFSKVDDNKFPYIKHKKCADVVVFKKIDETKWELKIIEFKRTISVDKWIEIKEQFKGAILNSMALSGLLGIKKVENIEVYSAYRNEKLSLKYINNPILLKQAVGEKPKEKIDDWEEGYIQLDLIDRKLKHYKIKLDEDGNGEVAL